MASPENKIGEAVQSDDDLDDEALLDSAYEDLVKVENTKDEPVAIKKSESKKEEAATMPKFDEKNLDEFLSTMESEFRQLMQATSSDPSSVADIEKMTAELQKAAAAAAASAQGSGAESADFAKIFGGDPESFLANMANISDGGNPSASSADDPSAGIMGALLSQLLSHDLLYPAIAQLRERYPAWLEKNKDSSEFERCSRQFEVVKRLCDSYEKQQTERNPSQSKSSNLNNIVSLVQELQACGDPPAELLEFDPFSANHAAAAAEQQSAQSSSEEGGGEECKVQ